MDDEKYTVAETIDWIDLIDIAGITLAEFRQWVDEIIRKVPEEFRETATITVHAHESDNTELRIRYIRSENEQERAKRIQLEKNKTAAKLIHLQNTIARLKRQETDLKKELEE